MRPTDDRDLSGFTQAAPPSHWPPGQLPFRPRSSPLPRPACIPRRSRVELFFAIRPPGTKIAAITGTRATFRDRHGMHGARIKDDCLHLTLAPVGIHTEELAARAIRLAGTVTVPAFEIGFDHARSFSQRTDTKAPFVLGVDPGCASGVHRLNLALMAALAADDIQSHYTFFPHLTLQHDEITVPRTPIPRITWTVRDFVLIHSHTGQGRHEVLHSWPLH